jgi:hypothetical protein
LHWSTGCVCLVVMHPWFVCSTNLVTHLLFRLHTVRDTARIEPVSKFFLCPSVLWTHFPKLQIIIHYSAKPWWHYSAVATLSIVIFLSAWINLSTHYAVVSVSVPTERPGRVSPASIERPWENLWLSMTHKHFPSYTGNISTWISFALNPSSHKKDTQQNSEYTHETRSPFWLLKPASDHAHARLLPRLSWSWTVLLPSDTLTNPVKSIRAVLLAFMTYLLTLHRNSWQHNWSRFTKSHFTPQILNWSATESCLNFINSAWFWF